MQRLLRDAPFRKKAPCPRQYFRHIRMLRQRKAQIPHNSGIQLRVPFQKAQRQPPRSRAACSRGVGHGGRQQRQRSLHRLCVTHPAHVSRTFSPGHTLHGAHQLRQAFAAAGRRRNDRHAQPLPQ